MKTKEKIEFGDFQTPFDLAKEAVQLLKSMRISPSAVVEPTCGLGSFLQASIAIFGTDIKYYFLQPILLSVKSNVRTSSRKIGKPFSSYFRRIFL